VRAALVAFALAVALVAGCGGGGDKPSKPLPEAPATMRLASTAFHNGALIPKRYTCSGEGTSPPLAILEPPAKTRELALLVEDPDADRFVHWTLLGISPDTALIGAGKVPTGAVQTENGFGDHAWGPPCPPEGDPPHHYLFTIYALDAPLGLGEDASADEVRDAIAEHALARGELTGRFGR
jgi:Raf kinase inhibitor-like YbhB/YbcL family protein